MSGFLFLGFLIGMAHALEADHLAAVGAMASGQRSSKKSLAIRGAAWGLGHAVTLFVVCAAVILLGLTLTGQASAVLEFAVGVMLVALGIDVLRKLWKKRIHFHVHTHDKGKPHLHAHSHEHAKKPHDADPHIHEHPQGFPVKAMLVGLLHGAAGSAGLLALTVAATGSPLVALSYVLLFGLGSILGMAVLSMVVAYPLAAAEKHTKLLHKMLSISAGAFAICLGLKVMHETIFVAFAGLI